MLGICVDYICMYMWSPSFTSSSFILKPILLWLIPQDSHCTLGFHDWWLPWLPLSPRPPGWRNVGESTLVMTWTQTAFSLVILSTQSSQPNNQVPNSTETSPNMRIPRFTMVIHFGPFAGVTQIRPGELHYSTHQGTNINFTNPLAEHARKTNASTQYT